MTFSSNPVRTNATQATYTRSFKECVLSLPDINLSCFYNVFMFKVRRTKLESPVTQITDSHIPVE